MMKKYLLFFLISFCAIKMQSQDPNWSVNAANYQYSMTFTAFLNLDGNTLTDTNDKVAAFVKGKTRGVANIEYVANADKYLVYLSVYANTSNEIISFKIYNNTNETVIDISKTQNFIIDGNVGGIFQTYSIASPALSKETVLNSFNFLGITEISQTIENNKIDIVLPKNSDITNLIAEFSLSEGAHFFTNNKKQVTGVSTQDFTNSILYKILSEDESEVVEYQVNVTKENTSSNPPEIILSSNATEFIKSAPVTIQMQTNEAIQDFSTDAILVTNAIVSAIRENDALNYTLEIVPIEQGVFSIEFPENTVLNNQNEGNIASNKLSFTYDLVSPYLVSIKRKSPINEITSNNTLEFTVAFNEAVSNVFANSFTSVSGATISLLKERDSKYIVTLKNIDNYIGAVSLNIKITNTIQDKAGNLLLNSVFNTQQN
jgi:hypothetical protein